MQFPYIIYYVLYTQILSCSVERWSPPVCTFLLAPYLPIFKTGRSVPYAKPLHMQAAQIGWGPTAGIYKGSVEPSLTDGQCINYVV